MIVAIWMIVGGLFGAVCGWLAVGRNRSAVPWWLLGVLAGPIALLVLLTKPDRRGERQAIL